MIETDQEVAADTQRPLPDGWRWVPLGDVIAEAQPGFASGARDPNGVIQMRMNNLDTRGNIHLDQFIRVPADQAAVRRYALVPGDILFNNTNSTDLVGKSALFHGATEPVVYSNHFTRLRPVSLQLDAEYLVLWLLSTWQAGTFRRICNVWIGQSAVKNDKLLSLFIPLPPVQEQRRIAAVLREQMAAVEQARAAAEAQLAAAKALPAAYLRAVFESDEAREWPIVEVSGLCSRIDYGYTASADFTITEPRFLRITDIQDGGVDWERVPGCKINTRDEAANALHDGDIVFARTGGTTGKSFLIKSPPRAVFASYLIRLEPNSQVSPEYLYAYFQSDGYWNQIRANARGGAQPNVNATLLGGITLPVPEPAKQRQITAMLKDQMAAADRAFQALEDQLDAINQLPAALLRQAFNGEL